MMSKVVVVIGGSRSGKTAFALGRAQEAAGVGSRVYIATAQPLDAEMEERIEKHRRERGSAWATCEEPLHLGRAVRAASGSSAVAVIDCLTLWLSNLLCSNLDVEEAQDDFIDSLRTPGRLRHIFVVSNEVGMGIVPENDMARRFRDMAGRLHQRLAGLADEVYLMVAGIPVKIK
jgi:adenosylcobinamide kinase/adenosylcobinamide-phosphate guanylyltransferase